MGQYKHHVFVCTSGKQCARAGADDVYAALKKGVKEAGLKGAVRVNQAGCMNQCGHGPMVVVYPDDVWYADVNVTGARRIVHDHLRGARPVDGYRYEAPPGDNKR
jgi:(2Fe-2S) ferredoxin